MPQHSFFTKPLHAASPSVRKDAMNLLEKFCKEVEEVTQGKVSCALVPGFLTGLGQEYRAIVHSKGKGIDHILFRAHVPTQGLPLSFDFYEEVMRKCDSVDQVSQALVDFAQLDSTGETLRLLSQ